MLREYWVVVVVVVVKVVQNEKLLQNVVKVYLFKDDLLINIICSRNNLASFILYIYIYFNLMDIS